MLGIGTTIAAEVVQLPKYAVIGGYTSEAWAKMLDNPGDRATAVRKVAEAVGAKLEQFYWSFGHDDYLAIFAAPDDITAGAISVAAGSPGPLRNLTTLTLSPQEGAQRV